MKVLEVPLDADETVYYVLERNMKRRRIIYSMLSVLLCGIAFMTLFTVVIPLFCAGGVFLCYFFGISPRGNAPIAWILTNKRYLCLYMNPQEHEKTEVLLQEYIDIEPLRENLESSAGGDIVAEIVMAPFIWIFGSLRDYFQDKNKKTSKKYWADSKGCVLTLSNEEQLKIDIEHKKTSSSIGRILALVLEEGWENIPECDQVPTVRTISLV